MNLIMKEWSDVDLDQLSLFLSENCLEFDNLKEKKALEIKTKLLEYKKKHLDSRIFLWFQEQELQGGVYLYCEEGKYFFFNPGFVGEFPIIKKSLNYSSAVKKLYSEVLKYISMNLPKIKSVHMDISPKFVKFEPTCNLLKILHEDVGFYKHYFRLLLPLKDLPLKPKPSSLDYGYSQVSKDIEEELYKCYYQSLLHSDLDIFKEQSEKERKAFFQELLDPEQMNYSASPIIRHQNKVIAFALIWNYNEELEKNAHINLMCVLPDYQHKGVGTLLLNKIITAAQQQKYTTATLYTENNRIPYKFYLKNGFKESPGYTTLIWNKKE